MVAPVKDNAWLQWIERLMAETGRGRVPRQLPPSQFHCLLDEQPDHLLPGSYLRSQEAAGFVDRQLFLNPECRLAHAGELPEHFDDAELLEKFALDCGVAWVSDIATGAWRPFCMSEELSSRLASLRPGDPAPSDLPANLRRALALADVLVPEDYEFFCRQRWAAVVARCEPQFRQKGYAPLSGLIHPLHIAALRRYYRQSIRTGQVWLGDDQSDRRYVAHNDSVARFFHHQLTAAFAEIAGQPLKPSYVYLASYEGGAQLHKHTDREQCEFSITLCVDYAPEPRFATPWPIYLDVPFGRVTVFQALGDALLYRGCELPHYRDPLPAGHTSTSIFFHYVNADFSGPLV